MKQWLWLFLLPASLWATHPVHQEIQPTPAARLTTNEIPLEIEVRADAITFLANGTVVTRDDLQFMDNPFDLLMLYFRTNRICPNIQWNTQPGGEVLTQQLCSKVDVVRIILGCEHRYSRLFEALDKSRQMDMDQDSPAFIPPKFRGISQEPVLIDVEADQLTLVEENKVITAQDLTQEDNEFVKFLDQMESHKDTHEIVLMLRPGSAIFQRRLRQMIRDRGMTLHFEPWETDRPIPLSHPPESTPAPAGNQRPPDMAPIDTTVHVTVQADSITILPGNEVVSLEELQADDNPFERLLDQFEDRGECPKICLMPKAGGEALCARLGTRIQERGARMGCWMGMISNAITVLVATPDKTPDPSLKPVFFECRSHQVFSISPARLRQAVDEKVAEIKAAANGDETEFLKGAAMTTLEVGGHRIDLTYALMGRYMLTMVPDAKGHEIGNGHPETGESGFASELADLDPETHSICFFVRPDSFKTFQRARALAWQKNFTVTLELLNEKEPILLNPPGVIMD